MDFKYHLGSSYSKCGSVDHERLSPLGVQNCSPTPAETDLNLQFNKILCWFSVWEVLGKISDSLICLWLTIRSTFLCYSPVGMYAHTHSNKSLWNSFHPLWGPVWYLLFRLSEILMNQWNNFIVWCADCKRSLESRGAHSRHYWHFKPGSSWLWVLEHVEQPPWLLPSRCQGQPLLNCNDPNSRRFQKYPWSGGYQNHCGLRTTDLDDPEVNAPHKQGSLTSLRATCPSATAVAHVWEACVASATENTLVNPRGDVEAVPVLEEDYVLGALCSETTSLWDIQESPPPSPCVPGGEAQSPVRDPEQEVSSAVQIPTLTSLDCFAFYNFIRTLVKKKNFFFLLLLGGYKLFLCVQKPKKKAQLEYFVHPKFPVQKRTVISLLFC